MICLNLSFYLNLHYLLTIPKKIYFQVDNFKFLRKEIDRFNSNSFTDFFALRGAQGVCLLFAQMSVYGLLLYSWEGLKGRRS